VTMCVDLGAAEGIAKNEQALNSRRRPEDASSSIALCCSPVAENARARRATARGARMVGARVKCVDVSVSGRIVEAAGAKLAPPQAV
jgi:hypothetical protein